MLRPLVALVACLSATALAQPPADPPAPPDGWKVMTGTDQSFQAFVPAKTSRTGTRSRTFRSGRLSFKVQLAYATLPDGLTLTAEAINLGGAAVRGAKADDVYKMIADGDREDGYTVSDLTPTRAGGLAGAAFTSTKGAETRKVVLAGGRPRVYALTATANDPALVAGKTADTFFNSLALTPEKAAALRDKQKADAAKGAEDAALAEADGTAPAWTLDPAKMTIPDKRAFGRVLGKPFVVSRAELFADAQLTLYGTPAGKAKADSVWVVLSPLNKGKLAGQSFDVAPVRAGGPTVSLTLEAAGDQKRRAEFGPRPAMKLEFGQPAGNRMLVKLYLCCDDKDKTVIAGTVDVLVK